MVKIIIYPFLLFYYISYFTFYFCSSRTFYRIFFLLCRIRSDRNKGWIYGFISARKKKLCLCQKWSNVGIFYTKRIYADLVVKPCRKNELSSDRMHLRTAQCRPMKIRLCILSLLISLS